jgi:hypothetical protein
MSHQAEVAEQSYALRPCDTRYRVRKVGMTYKTSGSLRVAVHRQDSDIIMQVEVGPRRTTQVARWRLPIGLHRSRRSSQSGRTPADLSNPVLTTVRLLYLYAARQRDYNEVCSVVRRGSCSTNK